MPDTPYDIPSVLESVKKFLGLDKDYTAFDADIVMHINSVFNILCQLGVGPENTFTITGYDQTWSSFLQGNSNLVMAKSFMFLKVRLLFDPPTGSAYTAFEANAKELEWRLNWQREVEMEEED